MSRRRRSFTLLELLVAIVIIAALYGLVMYCARIARESAYCLQVKTQLFGPAIRSGPHFLGWTDANCIRVQWEERGTPDHSAQIGVAEFDLEQNKFLNITYTPAH